MRVRKSAQARKAEIVDTTLRLADKLGPERLSTEAIAQAVGLTQPGVFRHFPKKQDLWEAVATRIGAMMEARWQMVTRPNDRPVDQIRALVAAQLRLIQSTPAIPAILFSRELHTRNKGLRTAFFALFGRFHALITALALRAQEANELRDDLASDDMAYLVIGLIQGLVLRWSISGRSFDLIAEGDRLLAVQLSGLTTAKRTTKAPRRA